MVAAEIALRAMGDSLPSGIAAERHDLGEVMRDPRWEDSAQLRDAGCGVVSTPSTNGRYGDIVRMGFIPPDVGNGDAAPLSLHHRR